MFSKPNVNIGLIGGQGYGKTVFLASLLELAHRRGINCINFRGNTNPKTREKYNQWSADFRHGKRIPTTSELLDVSFVLGAEGGSQWVLHFKDFAGENLDREKDLSENNANSGNVSKSNVERDKESLEKWFNSCDILIFLLPVNVVKHKWLQKVTDDVKTVKKLALFTSYIQQIKASGKKNLSGI